MTRLLNTTAPATTTRIRAIGKRLGKRLANVALDAASYAIACVCDSYPRLDERRQIHMLRMRLLSYEMRVSELELELHGSTLPSLPDVPDAVKTRDLN